MSVLMGSALFFEVGFDEVTLLDDDLLAGFTPSSTSAFRRVSRPFPHWPRCSAFSSEHDPVSPSKSCSAAHGTTSSAWRSLTVTRARTAAPGRHCPSELRIVARATVLWLAVAVPGRIRSSSWCLHPIAETSDLNRQPRRDVLRVAPKQMQVDPERGEVGDLEQRLLAGEITGARGDVQYGSPKRRSHRVRCQAHVALDHRESLTCLYEVTNTDRSLIERGPGYRARTRACLPSMGVSRPWTS